MSDLLDGNISQLERGGLAQTAVTSGSDEAKASSAVGTPLPVDLRLDGDGFGLDRIGLMAAGTAIGSSHSSGLRAIPGRFLRR